MGPLFGRKEAIYFWITGSASRLSFGGTASFTLAVQFCPTLVPGSHTSDGIAAVATLVAHACIISSTAAERIIIAGRRTLGGYGRPFACAEAMPSLTARNGLHHFK